MTAYRRRYCHRCCHCTLPDWWEMPSDLRALGGTRTPNLLIRSPGRQWTDVVPTQVKARMGTLVHRGPLVALLSALLSSAWRSE
jgi:hypothetical protein